MSGADNILSEGDPGEGDTRGWTETPQQKLLRLSAAERQRPQALEAAAPPQDAAAAQAVDAYNQSRRAKTLVDQHQEKLKVCSGTQSTVAPATSVT